MTRARIACLVAALAAWSAFVAVDPVGTTTAAFTSTTRNASNTITNLVVQAATQGTPTGSSGGSVSLSWTASPTESVAPLTYTVQRRPSGSGSYTDIASGLAQTSLTDWPPSDGSYDYVIRAVVSSFTRDSAVKTVLADGTAPSMAIACNSATCSTGWYTAAVSVTVSGTDAGSGMASVSRSLDGASTSTTSGSSASLTVSGDSTGHTVAYYGTDTYGNRSSTATQTIKIDSTAPTAASGVGGTTGGTTGTVNLTWTAGSDATSGLNGYDIQDVQVTSSCNGNLSWTTWGRVGTVTSTTVTGLTSNKKYCFRLVTYDVAGNTSTSAVTSSPIAAK